VTPPGSVFHGWGLLLRFDPAGVGACMGAACYKDVTPPGSVFMGGACYEDLTPLGSVPGLAIPFTNRCPSGVECPSSAANDEGMPPMGSEIK
jgi:hypothetical protein